MTKNHNMGRRSHLEKEAELQEELPEIKQETGDQLVRPTLHAHHIDKGSKKEPPVKPTPLAKQYGKL